jgi:uncharacterized protein
MSTISRFPRFVGVDLRLKKEITDFTNHFVGYSDFNFTNLHSWNNNGEIAVSWLAGNLVIRFRDYVSGEAFYTFLGQNEIYKTAYSLLDRAKSYGYPPHLKLIPEELALKLDESEMFTVCEDNANNDYILSLEGLSLLSGKQHAHTRELVNRFTRDYGEQSHFVKLELCDRQIRAKIQNVFAIREEAKNGNDHQNEAQAINRLLSNHQAYNLAAYGVMVSNELRAFVICELIPSSPVLAHFWKADTNFRGIYHFMLNNVCKELRQHGHEYLNFEQDLGIPGLRAAKQYLRPEKFFRKYTVSLNDALGWLETEGTDDMHGFGIAKVGRKYISAVDGVG